MAKEFYAEYSPKPRNREILKYITKLLASYSKQGISLTIRQIYYKVISKKYLTEVKDPYNTLSVLLTKARDAGLLDWNAIIDRTRTPIKHSEWRNINALLKTGLNAYRLHRWESQANYIEVITEKDTLYSALEPITNRYHVRLNVFRGNGSTTAVRDLANRILKAEAKNLTPTLVYIGDFDPSGRAMVKNIKERVTFYTRKEHCPVLDVALTMEQIEAEHLKPIHVNKKDNNAAEYIEQYGDRAWEVDALEPKILTDVVRRTILKYIDCKKMDAVIAREKEDKAVLEKFIEERFGS